MLLIMILLNFTYSWNLNIKGFFNKFPLQCAPIPKGLSFKDQVLYGLKDVNDRVCYQANRLKNSVKEMFENPSPTDEQPNGTEEGEQTTVNANSDTQGDLNNDNGSYVANKSNNKDNQPTLLSGLNNSLVNTEQNKDIGNDSNVNDSALTSDVTNKNTSAHSSHLVNPDTFKDTKPKDDTHKAMVPNKEDPYEEVDLGNIKMKEEKDSMTKLSHEVDKPVEKDGDSSTNASKVDNKDNLTPKATNVNIQNQSSNKVNAAAKKANVEYSKKIDGSNEVANTQNSDNLSDNKLFVNNSDNNSNKNKKDKENSSNSSFTQTSMSKLNQDKDNENLDVSEQDSTLKPKSQNVLNNYNTTQKNANALTAVTKANNNEDSWEIVGSEEYIPNQALQNDDNLDNDGLLSSTTGEKSNPDTKEAKKINRPYNDDDSKIEVISLEDEKLILDTDTDKDAKLYKQKNSPVAHNAKNPAEVTNEITPNKANNTISSTSELLELERALGNGTIREFLAGKNKGQAKNKTKR